MRAETLAGAIIEESQSSTDATQFRGRVLPHLARAVGVDAAIFLSLSPRGRLGLKPGTLYKEDSHRFVRMYAAHPQRYDETRRRNWAASAASRGVFHDRDVYSTTERDRLPFYADIVRPQRIVSLLVIGLSFHGHRLGQLHLERSGTSSPFRDRAASLLRRVVPTFEIAYMAIAASPASLSDAALTAASADPDLASLADRFARLTPRQRRIASEVASGFTNREIAALLGSSPNTVRNQLSAIFKTTGASDRIELALWAQALRDRR